ncbi:MAG: hypothetical protein NVSMB31_20030 [Vulcanimicrobiaceae bacterium]
MMERIEIHLLSASDAEAWWYVRLESLENEPLAFGKSIEEHRAITMEAATRRLADTPEGSFHLGAFENQTLIGLAKA